MSTTQITQITNGLRPLIEYVDLQLDEDLLIFTEVETIENCFGFSRGKRFETMTLNVTTGEISLMDSDAEYLGRIKITLPDQFDEFPRIGAGDDEESEEPEEDEDA